MRNIEAINNIERLIPIYTNYLTPIWEKKGKGFLYTMFTNDGPPRAFAAKERDFGAYSAYGITISKDLLYLLYEYLTIFLSDNDLFSGIGLSNTIIKVNSIRENDLTELAIQMNDNPYYIFDHDRLNLHNFLFNIILKLLTNHEFAHIIKGHVGLVKEYKDRGLKLSKIDKQTLETDADSFSAKWVCDEYLRYAENMDKPHPILSSKEYTVYSILFCHTLMMSISSYYFMTINMLRNLDHPNPYLRNYVASIAIISMVEDTLGKPYEYERNHLDDFFHTFDKVIEDTDRDEFEWTFSPGEEALKYQVKIFDNWAKIGPELEKHSMIELHGFRK